MYVEMNKYNIQYNNIDCLNDRFTWEQPAQSRGLTYDGFSGHFLFLKFIVFRFFSYI